MLRGKVTVFGAFSFGIRPTLKNAVEEINRLRGADGLGPLPDGFVCEKVDPKGLPPSYALSLSVLSTEDDSTSGAQQDAE
jgi:hypothetical protein